MLAQLEAEGFRLVSNLAQADVIIVNTCGFIEAAKQESIDSILECCGYKAGGRVKAVVATGCLAERYKDEMAKEIPELDVILGIGKNASLADAIRQALEGKRVVQAGEKTALSLEGRRILANQPHYAYIKVAEGCDNRCSYCAIPLIRGGFRSRPMENIVEECRALAKAGVREFNLVAQDTTRYGEDIYDKLMLPALIEQLCQIEELRWLRILYCYPERITDELLATMAAQPKVVRYLDIPFQHCNARILKAMNRKGSRQQQLDLLQKIRTALPGVTLRTTLITGFPGETQEEFEELCGFVQQARFERLGCFAYCAEEDTPAATLPGQLEQEEKQRRADILMQQQMDIAFAVAQGCVGLRLEVVVEGYDAERHMSYGRSTMDAPDIDTRVYMPQKLPVGSFVEVDIQTAEGYDLVGRVSERR